VIWYRMSENKMKSWTYRKTDINLPEKVVLTYMDQSLLQYKVYGQTKLINEVDVIPNATYRDPFDIYYRQVHTKYDMNIPNIVKTWSE